jgi:hypothetical protein
MKLTGLHLLLTYQCTFECDHCFAWGSPWQSGTLTLAATRDILEQARALGTVEWIYFEGGEPFMYYAALLRGVREAAGMGFQVGLVSNAYWAVSQEDALEWLRPLAGLVGDLSVSSDLYHYDEQLSRQVQNARAAAEQLGIPLGVISVAGPTSASASSRSARGSAEPEAGDAAMASGQLPAGESGVMYRGRAAVKLVERAALRPWEEFTSCPYEDLREPGRLHVDPLGNLHICQGIALGNLFQRPLGQVCAGYDPDAHPVTGPLLAGGPAELVRCYGLPHQAGYADACHLCYAARTELRRRFPEILGPDQMYGVF